MSSGSFRQSFASDATAKHAGTTSWEIWHPAGPRTTDTAFGGTFTLTVNVTYIHRVVVGRTMSVDAMGTLATTVTNTGALRFGIWKTASPTNEYPGALVVDAGTVTVTAATPIAHKVTLATAQSLPPGTYWFGMVCSVAGYIVRGPTNLNAMIADVGHPSSLAGTPYTHASGTLSTNAGAFPATFDGAATQAVVVSPSIYYRLSV